MDELDAEVVLDDLYELSIYELVFWCLMYSTIALLAVLGNALVLWVTLSRLSNNSIPNLFIINLAFSDLMTGLFAIPFKFQAALFQRWFLPHFLCHLVPFTETLSLSVSVFTLTTSAVHEFRTFFLPKNNQMSAPTCRALIVIIWLVAIAVSLPQGLFHEVFQYEESENNTIYQCRPVHADEDWWKAYNIYLTIIHYFVPLVVIDSAYSMIAFRICDTALRENNDNAPDYNQKISNRRLVKMLAIVVAVFSLCWFPLETYLLLNEVQPQINDWRYINVLFFCCHWLAMSNSCLNPIIYGVYNNKYKREYKRVLMRLRCVKLEDSDKECYYITDDKQTRKCNTENASTSRIASRRSSSVQHSLNGMI
ncbi:Substance-K receptor [Toxocara canis]|uniref:Substance-K receptor n=1 Tax=Toxocara canis TaxID=6265 RepID=A0A0B2VRW0_TOXCA|nr:Substance-K receptor [Toxocara canis]